MAVSAPVDATKTAAWAALQNHYNELTQQGISLKDWFAADDKRVEKLTFDVNDLRFDLFAKFGEIGGIDILQNQSQVELSVGR